MWSRNRHVLRWGSVVMATPTGQTLFLFLLDLVFGFVSAASRGVGLLAAGMEESAVAGNHFGLRQKE